MAARAPSSSPGCTSRSTASPTRTRGSGSPLTSTGCCATCGRPSRTGRRCGRRADQVADEIAAAPPAGVDTREVEETTELLRWLADAHFTFLGYREYVLRTGDDGVEDRLVAVPGSGLGILRADQPQDPDYGRLPRDVAALARKRTLCVVTKANSRSTVHRPAYLDYVGVKSFDADGNVVGERRFLGLFTSAAYNESIHHIPVLRRKAAEVLARSGFSANSHSGKDLLAILETYPRDELFQVSTDDLEATAIAVLHLQERRQLRLFLRRDDYGRFMSCMVYLPRDRYTTQVRQAMEAILMDAFDGTSIDYAALVSESVLARLHFVVRVDPNNSVPDIDPSDVEAELVLATRTWDDDFLDALRNSCGLEKAVRLANVYGDAFPEAYKEDLPAADAVADLHRLEALTNDGDIDLQLYTPRGATDGVRRLKLFHVGEPVSLSQVLPRLQEMGVEVVDERPYHVERNGLPAAWVYDFGLRYEPVEPIGDDARQRFQDAFAAIWSGACESDGFNALVLRAGLTWRQATVLRSYSKYLRQGGTAFSQTYIEECLTSNTHLARLLVALFEARFDPHRNAAGLASGGTGSEELVDGLIEEITGALDAVASLDQDRILRSLLGVIRATLRTSYFQTDADGRPKAYIAFKLDPHKVPDLPAPRPKFEIWVCSPRVEGVHLRFGPVARGGLRWSDRREDFRTEVLGLVKAQSVKNAVIVPVGAKGGFVVKRPPADPTDREAVLAEGIACYRMFISSLLDVTDNLVAVDGEQQVVPPPQVVRHDDDDAYLVVAADKGTATFSDIANGVAIDYGFWLGDAFASGGSVGYDHKAMGITARGAWESVKRHFRELGVDTQTEDFTVVGVGDMSGDVFGNGMLLSEHIRLVAAFDHRHVFLDPDPDPALSYAERRRLFDLPRSSWADYDTLSAVGGWRGAPADRQVDPDQRTGAGPSRPARRRRLDDAGRADEGHPRGTGRPAVERRHRHLRQGQQRVARRRRRQGQRRHPRRRRRPAGEGRRRGRQPRADPAGPDRVRGRRWSHQHRRDRQQRRRRHLRPRGQHQDPARPGRARRGDPGGAPQPAARRDDRRRRAPRAARQLRAERPARQRPGPGPGDALGARPAHQLAGVAG